MTTTKLDIHEAEANLARLLAGLQPGDRIVLCRRNEPVAQILPLASQSTAARPRGLGKGLARLKPEFFEPLPRELLKPFP